jgi:hypothetical protein
MTNLLHEQLEASADAAARTFLEHGRFGALWHMITADGESLFVGPISPDKNTQIAMVKALMVIRRVVRYVFVDEAWILECDQSELDQTYRDGIRNHPRRKEVLLISAEDQSLGMVMAHREIIREKGRPKLGPLVIHSDLKQSEGRMIGLLPPVGTRQ